MARIDDVIRRRPHPTKPGFVTEHYRDMANNEDVMVERDIRPGPPMLWSAFSGLNPRTLERDECTSHLHGRDRQRRENEKERNTRWSRAYRLHCVRYVKVARKKPSAPKVRGYRRRW